METPVPARPDGPLKDGWGSPEGILAWCAAGSFMGRRVDRSVKRRLFGAAWST